MTAERAPEVLVVMPVFNALPYLGEAVDSILQQTWTSYKFLIIDDGSTDGSYEYLKTLTDPRVRLERQEHGGPGVAMNHALQHAIHEGIPFLARMDADDLSAPTRLQKQLAWIKTHPDSAALSSNCTYIDTSGKVIGTSTVPITPAHVAKEIDRGLRGLIQGASLFRVESLAAIGGYRFHIPQAEDTDLFLRLSEKFDLSNLGETLYQIRVHPGSLSLANLEQNLHYHLYALRCHRLRLASKPEPSFEDFCAKIGLWDRTRLVEERLFLRFWRRGMLSSNPLYKILAALVSPRRGLARIARWCERISA